MTSILQEWVTGLGLRHQGVLLTAIRGCDGSAKNDLSKPIMRAIRWAVLVPFDERELTEPSGFIYFNPDNFPALATHFAKSLDQFPVHFVFHVMHALEVIGYYHPQAYVSNRFLTAYHDMCRKLHVNPETFAQMLMRLTEDRVASGTVAG